MPGRILIVDADATRRTLLRLKLSSASYEVDETNNSGTAQTLLHQQQPDVILLELPNELAENQDLCTRLIANAKLKNIPIIALTPVGDANARVRALNSGADDTLDLPVDELILLARIRNIRKTRGTLDELLRRSMTYQTLGFAEPQPDFARPSRIGLISGSAEQARDWHSDLKRHLGGKIDIYQHNQALKWSDAAECPDVLVITADLSRPDEGLGLLSELRSGLHSRHIAVLMILRSQAQQQAVLALGLGANDIMYEGFSARELALRVKTLSRQKQRTDNLRRRADDEIRFAAIDPLTELYNRRYACAHLDGIIRQSRETNREYAVLMLDIDRFKSINDHYGHAVGDTIIAGVAKRLRLHLRTGDLIARFGGEEFLIALPNTTLDEAQQISERLRHAIACLPFKTAYQTDCVQVTISAGVTMGTGNSDIDDLLLAADQALYGAKDKGRNIVNFAPAATA